MTHTLSKPIAMTLLCTSALLSLANEAAAQFTGQFSRSASIHFDRNVVLNGLQDIAHHRKPDLKGLFDVDVNIVGQFAGAGGSNASVIGPGFASSRGGNGNGNVFAPVPQPYPRPFPSFTPTPQPIGNVVPSGPVSPAPSFTVPSFPAPSYPYNQVYQQTGPGGASGAVFGGGTVFSQGGNGNGNIMYSPYFP
ncbi:MAG: hypothetical protein H6822_12850 [Planctomycetaceae bacterium]|nr:hypothetical protein [Planctomycetales bacterium]MCB9923065.1 hypothetical protein [Planctomycetaceae bacterium]